VSRLVLVTGGARSGKSTFAERRLGELAPGGPWRYVASATRSDEEMTARIEHHRARRDARWRTVEAPREVARAVAETPPGTAGVLFDCVTLWLANRLDERDDEILDGAERLAAAARALRVPVVVVTNEVGDGIVPMHPVSRRFRDLQGWTNQRLAAHADEVVLVACGLPLRLK
jgi:adenosylcobinamide kinase/adenosylcobinamide-phosphate guanylyltransferase